MRVQVQGRQSPLLQLLRYREELLGVTLDESDLSPVACPNADRYGSEPKILLLNVENGFTLEQPVQNDKTASESDRTVAFVQGHRYVSASALRDNPTTTSTLEE